MRSLGSVSFDAHSRIKDVLGSDLINSDNVAIIELIKNSRDAGSKSVDITFSTGKSNDGYFSQLTVRDSGLGMNFDDIKHKWLNIAYSDKRYNTDPKGRPYAGNKGIGRFSCDRLGEQLDLFTRTTGGKIIHVSIAWKDFEVDDRDKRVSDIALTANELNDRDFAEVSGSKELKHGTLLIIKNLRSSWDEKKLQGLRKELERFAIDRDRKFKVYLHARDFKDAEGLNGVIENKIFDKLDFRTTSIHSKIDEQGNTISTTLKHDANELFTLTEKNPFTLLKSINVSLYYLNQPAKAFFKRETGYVVKNFGSIFLFLNGFRVIPYGEPTNDWLSIDSRKAQGTKRFLGTREIGGIVEITDRDNQLVSDQIQVSSELNQATLQGYLQNLLRKFQRFVVEGLDWDRIDSELAPESIDWELNKHEFTNRDKNILESLASILYLNSLRENILNVSYNTKYLAQLAAKEISSYNALLADLEIKFKGLPLAQLKPADKRDINRFIARQAKALKAQAETSKHLQKRIAEVEKSKEQVTSENLFLRAQASQDPKVIEDLHHQVIIYADTIKKAIENYRADNEFENATKKLRGFLDRIQVQNEKILTISRHATNANFKISSAKVNAELFTFIKKYLSTLSELRIFNNIEIIDEIPEDLELAKRFRPLELTIAIDNLIVNARKSNASKIKFKAQKKNKTYFVKITDNGNGLSKEIDDAALIFQKGVTTSDGSGLGLYHLARIVDKELQGEVSVTNAAKGHFTIGLELK